MNTISMPAAGQSAPETPEYVPIPLSDLRTDAVVDTQIYIKLADAFVKYREPSVPFDESVRNRLREHNHRDIYILKDDCSRFNLYLEANLQKILSDPQVDDAVKSSALYTTTVNLVREMLNNPDSVEGIKSCQQAVELAADFIVSTPQALSNLFDIISQDYYIYTHSVNVMTYTISLAMKSGYPADTELKELGLSAMLHDVGKSFIDWNITNKSGPLTPDEFQMMKLHPEYAYHSLEKTGVIGEYPLFAIRHHHEKINGRGYPFGLAGAQVDKGVRIISICDIFDALSTRRVYRDAYSGFESLKIMKDKAGSEIDERVFLEFVHLLGEVK